MVDAKNIWALPSRLGMKLKQWICGRMRPILNSLNRLRLLMPGLARRIKRSRIVSHRQGQAGFTLLELLVVLVILGLLAALAGPRIVGYLGGARIESARLQIDAFGTALDLYRLDTGDYPSTEEGLGALIESPDGVDRWNGPYLNGSEPPLDPWGNPYLYRAPGEDAPYELTSLGADGRPGGEDDNEDISERR